MPLLWHPPNDQSTLIDSNFLSYKLTWFDWDSFGIFRLTDPPGLGIISGCHQRDFHPHPTERGVIIYKDISGAADGHAKFSSELSLQVIDLR